MTAVLTIAQAAERLSWHPNWVRTLARQGRIPASKIGRQWRFVEDDLVAWIRGGYTDAAWVQPSVDRKETAWHSGTVQENTTSSLQHRTEASLDALLGRPTGKRP